MRKLSRMEANKEVRRIVTRNGVDLSFSQYSVAGLDIRLTGWLCRTDQTNFNTKQIENMIHEFQRYLPNYSISGDYDNWTFSADHISYHGDPEDLADDEDSEMILKQQEHDVFEKNGGAIEESEREEIMGEEEEDPESQAS